MFTINYGQAPIGYHRPKNAGVTFHSGHKVNEIQRIMKSEPELFFLLLFLNDHTYYFACTVFQQSNTVIAGSTAAKYSAQ